MLLSDICLPVCLSARLSVHLSLRLCVYVSTCLYAFLSVCLSVQVYVFICLRTCVYREFTLLAHNFKNLPKFEFLVFFISNSELDGHGPYELLEHERARIRERFGTFLEESLTTPRPLPSACRPSIGTASASAALSDIH